METKYQQVADVYSRTVASEDPSELRGILTLLEAWGITQRQKDGDLLWVTLSTPTSIDGTIVIGYRYKKKDSSLTEDLFELRTAHPNSVQPFYKGRYQDTQLEYAKTHKQQNVENRSFTSVNTCCLRLGDPHGS